MERETNGNVISDVEQNQIFQSAYQETTICKSTKLHGNGYIEKYPTGRQLLSEDYQHHVRQDEALMDALLKLKKELKLKRKKGQLKGQNIGVKWKK